MEERDRIRSYIPIIRGLISYHERMQMVTEKKTPEDEMRDLYLEALKEALRLMEERVG